MWGRTQTVTSGARCLTRQCPRRMAGALLCEQVLETAGARSRRAGSGPAAAPFEEGLEDNCVPLVGQDQPGRQVEHERGPGDQGEEQVRDPDERDVDVQL